MLHVSAQAVARCSLVRGARNAPDDGYALTAFAIAMPWSAAKTSRRAGVASGVTVSCRTASLQYGSAVLDAGRNEVCE
jgi:hypothetical protein